MQYTANKNSFKEKVIKLADEIAQKTYPLTYKFPSEERFALGDQLRRAIISIPCNIIEGFARSSRKELKQFIYIAYGSLKESKYLLYFSFKQNLINKEDYLRISEKIEELSRLLYVFLQKLKSTT